MFLKIDGIEGDSIDHKHKGEIEILSFSWGLNNSGTMAHGGGGGEGKASFKDISFVTSVSTASPRLVEKCCTGQHISSAQLTVATKETRQEFFKIKLSDCIISSYQTGAGGGAVPMDQVSFVFGSIDIQAANRNGQFEQVSCDATGKFSDASGQNHNH
jgi:type VI secretion system secreted protein Hcp